MEKNIITLVKRKHDWLHNISQNRHKANGTIKKKEHNFKMIKEKFIKRTKRF